MSKAVTANSSLLWEIFVQGKGIHPIYFLLFIVKKPQQLQVPVKISGES